MRKAAPSCGSPVSRVIGVTVTSGAWAKMARSFSGSGVMTRSERVECSATKSATVVVSRMRPWPMMTRLSAVRATSLIRCELNSTARPCAA